MARQCVDAPRVLSALAREAGPGLVGIAQHEAGPLEPPARLVELGALDAHLGLGLELEIQHEVFQTVASDRAK